MVEFEQYKYEWNQYKDKVKEKADQEFQKEIQFLRKCFEGDEHQAQQLTQLRLAKEINESILDQYDLIRKAEPSMVYRRVGMDLCVHI